MPRGRAAKPAQPVAKLKKPATSGGKGGKKAPPDERSRIRPGAIAALPTGSFTDWDRVGQVKTTLKGYESGTGYESAGRLQDAMMGDDRIKGVASKRAGNLVSSTLVVDGATTKRVAKKIASVLAGTEDNAGLWNRMFPPAVLKDMLVTGWFVGIAIAELVWDTSNPNMHVPTLRFWHPQFYRWDWKTGLYSVMTADGLVEIPSTEFGGRSDGKWVIWTPSGYRDPWRHSYLRPMSMLYLARQWTYRDWSRYNEKHGDPMTILEAPEDAPPDEKSDMLNMVANRGGEAAFLLPQQSGGAEVAQYKLSMVEAMARSFDSFQAHLDKVETNIAVLVLGQNLSTEVQGGSYAAADAHEGIELQRRREDAALADVLREQVLTHWAFANFGDPELAPRPWYDVDDPGDELTEAQTLTAIGDGVTALQLAGFRVDLEAVSEKYGIPVQPVDAETDAAGDNAGAGSKTVVVTPSAMAAIIKVNEARAASGLGPAVTESGALDPDGNLTIAEYQAKHAEVLTAAAKVESGVAPGDEQPLGGAGAGAGDQAGAGTVDPALGGPQVRTQERTQARALARLPGAGIVRLGARPAATAAGAKRAASYADALQSAAKKRAAAALTTSLEAINEEIAKAKDYGDLRRRILARYKAKLTGEALARVVERANIMANLSGRLGALEDL